MLIEIMSKKYQVTATVISRLHAENISKWISDFNKIPLHTDYNMKKV